tara:strand:+ start:169 stop:438 length:270 start_codon:yes stop_codon:yes gene_type:complete
LEISVDAVPSQKAWAESIDGIQFHILADFHEKGATSNAFGVYNKERGVANRSVFIINEQGKVIYSQLYPPGELPDPSRILEELDKMGES